MEAITFGRFLRKCLIDVINRIESDFFNAKTERNSRFKQTSSLPQ